MGVLAVSCPLLIEPLLRLMGSEWIGAGHGTASTGVVLALVMTMNGVVALGSLAVAPKG